MSLVEQLNRRGKTRVQRMLQSSDKTIQAEMKNKQEAARLNLHRKILDKQYMHLKFSIEKEKLLSKRFMSQMVKKTTGVSQAGVPPEGPWDTTHQKSPYFHCEAAVSEKRIKHWRQTEAKLQRDLKHMAGSEISTVDDPEKKAREKNKLRIVLGMMGYNDDDTEEILETMDKDGKGVQPKVNKCTNDDTDGKNGPKSLKDLKRTSYAAPDVFASLRVIEQNDTGEHNERKNIVFNGGASKVTPKEASFDVKDWEKKVMENYIKRASSVSTNYVRRPDTAEKLEPTSDTENRKLVTLPSKKEVNTAKDRTSKNSSSSSLSESDAKMDLVPKQNVISPRFSKVVQFRPHSANGTQRKSDIEFLKQQKRPKTAGSKGSVKVNNFIQRDDINQSCRKDSNDNGIHSSDMVTKIRENMTDQNYCKSPTDTTQNISSSKRLGGINRTQDNGKLDIPTPRSVLKSTSASSIASNISQVTAKSSGSEVFLSEDEKVSIAKKQVSFSASDQTQMKKKVLERRKSFHEIPKAKPQLERRKTLHTIPFSQQNIPLLKSETLQSSYAEFEKSLQSRRFSSHGENHHLEHKDRLVSTDSVDMANIDHIFDTPGASLPRWKRDLLREAPPSVFTAKSNPKFGLTVSRAKLRRELQQMVEDNTHNVKKIIGIEQQRRRQSRANIFMTMIKVKKAVETFKNKVTENSNKTTTLESSDSVPT